MLVVLVDTKKLDYDIHSLVKGSGRGIFLFFTGKYKKGPADWQRGEESFQGRTI